MASVATLTAPTDIDDTMVIKRLKNMQPLYLQIADKLVSEIVDGHLPVGGLIPTEAQLCESYKVSRHTIREALKQLQNMGMTTSRRGIGTLVVSKTLPHDEGRFTASFDSIDELVQFAKQTRFSVLGSTLRAVDQPLAEKLSCPEGELFLVVEGVRTPLDDETPISWHEVYISKPYAGIAANLSSLSGPLCEEIEKAFDVRIMEIQQHIKPKVLDKKLSERLNCPVNSPALEIQRIYISDNNEIIENAFSVLVGDFASLSIVLSHES